jgi:peptidoglycan/xylan/chitin deacetylase (PgdA/CDA1 family)
MLSLKHKLYYPIKPYIPRGLQIFFRNKLARWQRVTVKGLWPIDERAAVPPLQWRGWPEQKRFALVLTHDVESAKGVNRCLKLADLEERHGFRSSFNFVAEDYYTPREMRTELVSRGFEVGLHGLSHDCSLFRSRDSFTKQSLVINRYLREWGCVGFRSPAMHRNLIWLHDLDIEYDASTFDTDPFEPNPEGVHTIFPFMIEKRGTPSSYVELPYTMTQDFTLYVILGEKNTDIWKRKLSWIADYGGMALLLTHPDYMALNVEGPDKYEYDASLYEELLIHIKELYQGAYWHVLPKDMARFWKENYPNHYSPTDNQSL